jgi:nuclear GTP-binding protein
MKRIFLIDCPGIVPPSAKDTSEEILFRGVVRVEHVNHAEQYIPGILKRCQRTHLERTYEIKGWNNATEFIELIARKHGRLLKGGEADEQSISKLVINDFNRGKIPWFVPPPEDEERPRKKIRTENNDEEKSAEEEEEEKEEAEAEAEANALETEEQSEDKPEDNVKEKTEGEWEGFKD